MAEWHGLVDLGFLWTGRDYKQAGTWFRQALDFAEKLANPMLRARSLNRPGNWLGNTGQPEEGLQAHREALSIFEMKQGEKTMGTAQVQGDLWGVQARDWANIQERTGLPAFEAVLEHTKVGRGTRLLDVGCGAGMAAQLAAALGAQVTGIDASTNMLEIARERVPAGDFRVGEIEELPYADHSFDLVTGFNSFQYAASPLTALKEARRVTRPGGRVVMMLWGRAQDCEAAATLAAVGKCLPPPPGAGGPFALSEPGLVESLMEQAGLTPIESGEVSCPFEFPDAETAWRGYASSGPLVRAVRHAGEAAVKQAVLDSLAPFKTNGGGYRQENTYRYVIASV